MAQAAELTSESVADVVAAQNLATTAMLNGLDADMAFTRDGMTLSDTAATAGDAHAVNQMDQSFADTATAAADMSSSLIDGFDGTVAGVQNGEDILTRLTADQRAAALAAADARTDIRQENAAVLEIVAGRVRDAVTQGTKMGSGLDI